MFELFVLIVMLTPAVLAAFGIMWLVSAFEARAERKREREYRQRYSNVPPPQHPHIWRVK